MPKRGKKYQQQLALFDRQQRYGVDEAIELITSGGSVVRLLVRRGTMPPAVLLGMFAQKPPTSLSFIDSFVSCRSSRSFALIPDSDAVNVVGNGRRHDGPSHVCHVSADLRVQRHHRDGPGQLRHRKHGPVQFTARGSSAPRPSDVVGRHDVVEQRGAVRGNVERLPKRSHQPEFATHASPQRSDGRWRPRRLLLQ